MNIQSRLYKRLDRSKCFCKFSVTLPGELRIGARCSAKGETSMCTVFNVIIYNLKSNFTIIITSLCHFNVYVHFELR